MPQPLMSDEPLLVVANPFVHLDHKGRPAGLVQYDPEYAGGDVRYIGASLERVVVVARQKFDANLSRRAANITHDLTPQPVVDSVFHREHVKSGALLAANASTANRCGQKAFVQLGDALNAAFAAAVAEHERETGKTADVASWFAGEEPLIANWPGPLPAGAAQSAAAAVTGGDA